MHRKEERCHHIVRWECCRPGIATVLSSNPPKHTQNFNRLFVLLNFANMKF